ncbi:14-3-3 protein beta/alpha-1 [Oopsacas minuta]|uniref:14-3-3 protein beta/alpha-1 n=1 Tax=Oopsacas minuta TaxID=111878 RepID=A0AAV7J8M6_9METZ|nr:14-3-3 protein beta/alpha-1 [Oopsacas minuta]
MAETFLQQAKYAEAMERYEDMRKFMESEYRVMFENNGTIPPEHRNLLSVAYKNVVGAKRSSWRTICSIQEKEENGQAKNKDQKLTIIKKVKSAIEEDLDEISNSLLNLIDSYKLCNAHFEGTDDPNLVSNVFYSKMKGDYYRYMAEYKSGDERKIVVEKASEVYKQAEELAKPLQSTHPIKLGLALNYSVFHYEILSNPEEACKLAKMTFDSAIADLDLLKDDTYKDGALIMSLLRDNLSLWTAEIQSEAPTGEEGTGDQ